MCLHGGQQDSGGLPHSSTEVERPLRAKPHPSKCSVLCTAPPLLWKNIDNFILIIVGLGGWRWGGVDGGCRVVLGSIRITGDSHHTWLLVRPQADLNFLHSSISIQFDRTHPVVKSDYTEKHSRLCKCTNCHCYESLSRGKGRCWNDLSTKSGLAQNTPCMDLYFTQKLGMLIL